jgi:Na+-translocating ferredoxin:NAD+ oxidoreductase subunit G
MTSDNVTAIDEKNKINWKEIVKTSLNLVVFCFVVAFVLSFFNEMTRERIETNRIERIQSVQRQLIEAEQYEYMEGFEAPTRVAQALDNGELTGYVVEAQTTGYGGVIQIMYGVNPDFEIQGVRIVSQRETPGLGDQVTREPFLGQFEGRSRNELDQVDTITGATVSSSAVINGVRSSLVQLQERVDQD